MEQKKASEIIIELEEKVNTLLSLAHTQDLNIKILSNKLNSLMEVVQKLVNKPTIEAPILPPQAQVQDPRKIFISGNSKIPLEDGNREGFRRTSRPESFAGDNAYLEQPVAPINPKFPTQIPDAEVIIPKNIIEKQPVQEPIKQEFVKEELPEPPQETAPAVQVEQRVVDKNGKSVFMANFEVVDSIGNKVAKGRTNGNGKWMASLKPGSYRVSISKMEALTKEKLEAVQDLRIDENSPSLLPMKTLIIR